MAAGQTAVFLDGDRFDWDDIEITETPAGLVLDIEPLDYRLVLPGETQESFDGHLFFA